MTDHRACCPDLWYPAPGAGATALRCDAVILTFSTDEISTAGRVAVERMQAARGLPHMGGEYGQGDELAKRALGAIGELAVARVLGVPFDPAPFGLDVGACNVRTRGRLDYELIIRPYDVRAHPAVPYILVSTDPGGWVAILRGWLTPVEAVRDEWRHAHGGGPPAYFVPQPALHDLRRLRS